MKNLTLKIALVAVATILGLNGFAQTNNTGQWATTSTVGKYSQSAAAPITDYTLLNYADSITVGKTMPFFVWPSAAYNPTWNPTAAYAVPAYPTETELETGVVSKFAWRGGSDYASLAAIAGFTKNYVEITLPATPGNYMIEVTETPASNICPGIPVYFGVQTIAAPSASFTLSATPTNYGLDSIMVSACAGDASLTTAIGTITGDANSYNVNLGFKAYTVDALDGTGNIDLATATDVTSLPGNMLVKGSVNSAATPTAANPIIVPTKATPIVASQAYDVIGSKITVYEFTYHGLNGKISRKSDYLAARAGNWSATDYDKFTYYGGATPTTGETYYIIAFPKPVTGPIYHIANNFAY